MGCLIINVKPFDFGADPDHVPDVGIFSGFLRMRDRGNCKNFAGSAALAEVCALRMFLQCFKNVRTLIIY